MRLGPTAQRELTKSRWQRKDSPTPNDLQGLYGDSPNLSVPMQLDPTERRGPHKAVPVSPPWISTSIQADEVPFGEVSIMSGFFLKEVINLLPK